MSRKAKPTPEKYCLICGELLERKRYNGRLEDLTVFKKRKYCNQNCMAISYLKIESDTKRSPSNSRATARIINQRILNQTKCEECGADGKLDVHHIDDDYTNNTEKNLMVLCRSCHMKIHKTKKKCKICGDKVKGLGYCNKHYLRFKKYGSHYIVHGKVVSE